MFYNGINIASQFTCEIDMILQHQERILTHPRKSETCYRREFELETINLKYITSTQQSPLAFVRTRLMGARELNRF